MYNVSKAVDQVGVYYVTHKNRKLVFKEPLMGATVVQLRVRANNELEAIKIVKAKEYLSTTDPILAP